MLLRDPCFDVLYSSGAHNHHSGFHDLTGQQLCAPSGIYVWILCEHTLRQKLAINGQDRDGGGTSYIYYSRAALAARLAKQRRLTARKKGLGGVFVGAFVVVRLSKDALWVVVRRNSTTREASQRGA
jgi:hypothetical protein